MSNKFVNKSLTVSTSITDIYKCSGDSSVLFGLSLANNIDNSITVSVYLVSDSEGTTTALIAPNTIIDNGETLTPIGGTQKIVMMKNDILQVQCSTGSGVDVIASAIEFSDFT